MKKELKLSVYDIVTSKLLEMLESGENPWRKTWKALALHGQPFNLKSKRGYSGSNIMLLGFQDAPCSAWVTYKQAKDLGGQVKKGVKSSIVTYWKFVRVKGKNGDPDKTIPFLRYYNVFNALRDCEGLEDRVKKFSGEKIVDSIPAEAIDTYLQKEGIELKHGGNRACYSPSADQVSMPHQQAFVSGDDYQSVLAHECIHSTGHKNRLDRFKGASFFGSEDYSFEELVAETGACLLCAEMGIEPNFRNSASYLAGWAKSIKENPKWFVQASGKAAKAVDMILDRVKEVTKA